MGQWRDVAFLLPAKPGVYEILLPGFQNRLFANWNGVRWGTICLTPRRAAVLWNHPCYYTRFQWRGLLTETGAP